MMLRSPDGACQTFTTDVSGIYYFTRLTQFRIYIIFETHTTSLSTIDFVTGQQITRAVIKLTATGLPIFTNPKK